MSFEWSDILLILSSCTCCEVKFSQRCQTQNYSGTSAFLGKDRVEYDVIFLPLGMILFYFGGSGGGAFCQVHFNMFFFFLVSEGRPGVADVSPLSGISGLSFDSTLLSPLLFLCLVLLLFLSYLLLLHTGPFYFFFFQKKIFKYFSLSVSCCFIVWLLFSS